MIREALDNDKNTNKRVARMQIKNVPKDEVALLQSELNTEEIQTMSIYVSSLRKVFEHKAHVSKTMLSYNIKPTTLNKFIVDISSIEEIMTMYSCVGGICRKLGNNPQTRLTAQCIFMSVGSYVANIVKNLRMVTPRVSGVVGANMSSFIMALSLHELTDAQLKKGFF